MKTSVLYAKKEYAEALWVNLQAENERIGKKWYVRRDDENGFSFHAPEYDFDKKRFVHNENGKIPRIEIFRFENNGGRISIYWNELYITIPA